MGRRMQSEVCVWQLSQDGHFRPDQIAQPVDGNISAGHKPEDSNHFQKDPEIIKNLNLILQI